jgi:hypothetical protein
MQARSLGSRVWTLGRLFSAVTFGKIQKVVELTRQQDPAKANEIDWATQLASVSEVLSRDATCFREYARLVHRHSDTVKMARSHRSHLWTEGSHA